MMVGVVWCGTGVALLLWLARVTYILLRSASFEEKLTPREVPARLDLVADCQEEAALAADDVRAVVGQQLRQLPVDIAHHEAHVFVEEGAYRTAVVQWVADVEELRPIRDEHVHDTVLLTVDLVDAVGGVQNFSEH
jgi:hypothetical protein